MEPSSAVGDSAGSDGARGSSCTDVAPVTGAAAGSPPASTAANSMPAGTAASVHHDKSVNDESLAGVERGSRPAADAHERCSKAVQPSDAVGGDDGPDASRGSNLWRDSERQAVLTIEYMSDFTTRVLLCQFRAALAAALALLSYETYIKFHDNNKELMEGSGLITINAAVASSALAALLSLGGLLAWRLWKVHRAGKVWAPRRQRAVLLIGVELAIQILNLVFYLAPNALVLAQPCSWFLTPVFAFSAIRWTCWNSMFCLFVVQAHTPMPAQYTGQQLLLAAASEVAAPARAAGRLLRHSAGHLRQSLGPKLRRARCASDGAAAAAAAAEDLWQAGEAKEPEGLVGSQTVKAGASPGADSTAVSAADLSGLEAGTRAPSSSRSVRVEPMVGDLPLKGHLNKVLLLWLPTQLCIIFTLCYELGAFGGKKRPCSSLTDTRCYPQSVNGVEDCRNWRYPCNINDTSMALTSLSSALLILTLLIYFVLLAFAQRQLAKRPYAIYRISNIVLRLQYQTRLFAAAFFVLSNTLFWYVGGKSCTRYLETWMGLTPMEIVMTSLVAFNTICIMPRDPAHRGRELFTWLQDFAWLESDLPRKVAQRPVPASEPMFCVETALKCLCWSWVAYQDDEEEQEKGQAAGETAAARGAVGSPHSSSGVSSSPAQNGSPQASDLQDAAPGGEPGDGKLGRSSSGSGKADGGSGEDDGDELSLATALGLFGLRQHRVLWGPEHDAKCLVGWGDDGTIVFCFRGTVSLRNMLSNMQVWRAPHPPSRGSYWLCRQPMVHWGFLQTWHANGLNVQVMDTLRELLTTAPPPPSGHPWLLTFTGHSLGGALASLAAYDAVQLCRQLGLHISTNGRRRQHSKRSRDAGSSGEASGGGGTRPGGASRAVQVTVYTFGAPRPGNHAFARDYQAQVPASFDVIHADDTVTRNGKFLVLYKRAAHRVVLTETGDLIVRPSLIERSARESFHTSLQQHMLTAYGRSFAALIRGQFQPEKEHNRGQRGCRALLRSRYVRQVLRATAGVRQESLARFSRLGTMQGQAGPAGNDQHLATGARLPERQRSAPHTISLASSLLLARALTWSPQPSAARSWAARPGGSSRQQAPAGRSKEEQQDGPAGDGRV